MADEFKVGDIVYLKSGGPDMTVKISIDNWSTAAEVMAVGVHCDWFDDNKILHSAVFHEKEIVKRIDENKEE
jgi:uncharacterized protein YodC (DUF2158 family)